MCTYVSTRVSAAQRPKVSSPLELELKVVVSHRVWVMGLKLRFSVKAADALNC